LTSEERGIGYWEEHASLADWRDAREKEILAGRAVGMHVNPALERAGVGEQLTDPRQLHQLHAYRLTGDSPLRGAGLDLQKLFGWDLGTIDFYGNLLSQHGGVAIGIDQGLDQGER